ncbi:hypothetical protein CCACVL1_20518, partial [Corchorus capsularis]
TKQEVNASCTWKVIYPMAFLVISKPRDNSVAHSAA